VKLPVASVCKSDEMAMSRPPRVKEVTVEKGLKSLPVRVTLVPGVPFAGLGVRVGLGTEWRAVAEVDVPAIIALTVLSLEGMGVFRGTSKVVVKPPEASG
jgi:hypothetical protein